ncbi:hypothetical protein FHX76_000428 [Lysinibacter cavernae]|uniref:Uncharacterized protein n=1 Tax=Lysinibacter cavernae TaxID=1640652 RepID=A0A7X5QYX2_9MICO|nr:hypothetical protein [Lysinibacter cavernae]
MTFDKIPAVTVTKAAAPMSHPRADGGKVSP